MEPQDVVSDQWGQIAPVLSEVRRVKEFSLSLPCVVTSPDTPAEKIPLSALSSVLKASPSMSSPLMEEFQVLASEVGAEEAFMALANGEDGEEFCHLWDESRKEVAGGSRATIDDVVEAIEVARQGFLSTPRKMLVVVLQGKSTEVTLVS